MNRQVLIIGGSLAVAAIILLAIFAPSPLREPKGPAKITTSKPVTVPPSLPDNARANQERLDLRQEVGLALEEEEFLARTSRLRILFSDWAGSDPSGAARMLVEMHPKYRDYDAVAAVARALALRDPLLALEFAKQVDDYRLADFIQRIALELWGQKDPLAAAQYVLANFPEKQQAHALDVFAKSWGAKDPAAALAFAQNLPVTVSRDYYLAEVFTGFAAKNPQAALQKWNQLTDENANRESLANIIAKEWSQQDPEAAATWAASLAESDPARETALIQSMSALSQSNPVKASQMIDQLPRSESRDKVIIAFVNAVSPIDPDSATEWAKSIERHEMRRAAYQKIAQYYSTQDLAAGQEWINSLDAIPQSWLKDLARRINQDGSSILDE